MNNRRDKIISILINHFNSNGWPIHITEEKLNSRAGLATDDSYPDAQIVEIERHRPALGEIYVPGLPMSNYQTYYMRYAVKETTGDVIEIAERVGVLSINADNLAESHLTTSDFSLQIEGIEECKYEITDLSTGESAIISNLNDATSFLSDIIENYVDCFAELQLGLNSVELGLDASKSDHLIEEYGNAIKYSVFLEAKEAWINREEYDPEN